MKDLLANTVTTAYTHGKGIATTVSVSPHHQPTFISECNHFMFRSLTYKEHEEKVDGVWCDWDLWEVWAVAFKIGVEEVRRERMQLEPRPTSMAYGRSTHRRSFPTSSYEQVEL